MYITLLEARASLNGISFVYISSHAIRSAVKNKQKPIYTIHPLSTRVAQNFNTVQFSFLPPILQVISQNEVPAASTLPSATSPYGFSFSLSPFGPPVATASPPPPPPAAAHIANKSACNYRRQGLPESRRAHTPFPIKFSAKINS